MKAVKEFSRFASSYGHYSIIQRQAAEYLVSWIEEKEIGGVLDLGCGNGEIFRQIGKRGLKFDAFLGVDLAESMLDLHPRDGRIRCLQGDFNDMDFLDTLSDYDPDTVISSSALQWSHDLDGTLGVLSRVGTRSYFSIFTSGTFATLHRTAGIVSPIRSFEETERILENHYRIGRLERVRYRLYFDSKEEIFRYIKRSGVSGGEARLSYRQIRRLMEEYPLDYLEYEILLIHEKSLQRN